MAVGAPTLYTARITAAWAIKGEHIMSYTLTTLKQAIKDYVENDETTFVNNLDNFIKNTRRAYS